MEPAEARGAFKKLAYSNYNGMPLYLEWAPIGVFKDKKEIGDVVASAVDSEESKALPADQIQLENSISAITDIDYGSSAELIEDAVPEPDTTIFVKNLNFNTKEEALKNVWLNTYTL